VTKLCSAANDAMCQERTFNRPRGDLRLSRQRVDSGFN
jgi:hypothetical protein